MERSGGLRIPGPRSCSALAAGRGRPTTGELGSGSRPPARTRLRGGRSSSFTAVKTSRPGRPPLAAHAPASRPSCWRRHGKGLTVYLNFYLPPYNVVTRELVRQILRPGRHPAERRGREPGRLTRRRGAMNEIRFPVGRSRPCLIRDHRRCSNSDPADPVSPRPRICMIFGGRNISAGPTRSTPRWCRAKRPCMPVCRIA